MDRRKRPSVKDRFLERIPAQGIGRGHQAIDTRPGLGIVFDLETPEQFIREIGVVAHEHHVATGAKRRFGPRKDVADKAPSTPSGNINRLTNGMVQLSYKAATQRKITSMEKI